MGQRARRAPPPLRAPLSCGVLPRPPRLLAPLLVLAACTGPGADPDGTATTGDTTGGTTAIPPMPNPTDGTTAIPPMPNPTSP